MMTFLWDDTSVYYKPAVCNIIQSYKGSSCMFLIQKPVAARPTYFHVFLLDFNCIPTSGRTTLIQKWIKTWVPTRHFLYHIIIKQILTESLTISYNLFTSIILYYMGISFWHFCTTGTYWNNIPRLLVQITC